MAGIRSIGQSEAQHYERQRLRPEAGDVGQEDAEIPIVDREGAGYGQHAGRQYREHIAALGQDQEALTQTGRGTGRRLARQPSDDPEQRERR